MGNSVVAHIPMPIVVPITLIVVLRVTFAMFPRVNVSKTKLAQHPLLFPSWRSKLFKLRTELAPLELVLPRKLVAASEVVDNGVAALTLRPIAVPTTLTVVLVVTSAIFPRANVSTTERTQQQL